MALASYWGTGAKQNRLRQEHDLLVPRDLVMFDLDEEGLAARCPIGKKGKRKGISQQGG